MKIIVIPFLALLAGFHLPGNRKTSLSFHDQYFINRFAMVEDTPRTIVSVEQVILKPMTVLYIRDTARITDISANFRKDYGELFQLIGGQGLRSGKMMTFYHHYGDPVIFEAAVEVDRAPVNMTGKIMVKMVRGGEAIVAHFKGPYEMMAQPYNAIAKWLKDNGKQADGLPFESYLNDPEDVKDKYELLTDIYQLLK